MLSKDEFKDNPLAYIKYLYDVWMIVLERMRLDYGKDLKPSDIKWHIERYKSEIERLNTQYVKQLQMYFKPTEEQINTISNMPLKPESVMSLNVRNYALMLKRQIDESDKKFLSNANSIVDPKYYYYEYWRFVSTMHEKLADDPGDWDDLTGEMFIKNDNVKSLYGKFQFQPSVRKSVQLHSIIVSDPIYIYTGIRKNVLSVSNVVQDEQIIRPIINMLGELLKPNDIIMSVPEEDAPDLTFVDKKNMSEKMRRYLSHDPCKPGYIRNPLTCRCIGMRPPHNKERCDFAAKDADETIYNLQLVGYTKKEAEGFLNLFKKDWAADCIKLRGRKKQILKQ